MIENDLLILELLKKRGIEKEEDIVEFLSEKPQKTYDPFLLLNMKAGVDFVLKAIREKKKIFIYGDYDVDGITSTVILKTVLEHIIGEKNSIDYYIPSRFREGYGLSNGALAKIKEMGGEVVITVDCGSVSTNEVEYAKNIGLEIMITDHHTVSAQKPDCLIINPKQKECNYPFKHLAGCGVAFKLSQALLIESKLGTKFTHGLLDILAIGTVADVVPLVDENRTFIKYGLRMMNQKKRRAIAKLLEMIGSGKEIINSETIGFRIGPHLNAAGRMASAKIGVKLFLEEDANKQDEIIRELMDYNNERKSIQEEIQKNCEKYIEENCRNKDFFLIYAEDAHEGITGIVASKIKEKYNRPTAILTNSEGNLKGTSRSIESIDLHDFLKSIDDLFLKFGGHKGACGFSMQKENLPMLIDRVSEKIEKMKVENEELFVINTKSEIVCRVENVTVDFIEKLEKIGPFGTSNEKPILEISDIRVKSKNLIGENGKHIKFTVEEEGKSLECIMFFADEKHKNIIFADKKVSVLGTLSINEWNNRKTPQMIVSAVNFA